MPLTVGSRLGHYDVTALIGEGGMGQVYQATDTKLNRQVALKILPEAFATDSDRLARFQREAQVLASLNHPGIAAIYGIEESGDTRALVLELVEGPTLADRVAQGPIPVDEALPIAKQIAEALEAAHEAGVIHRDLKPANIKVREDGTVKVLDFGLAKALDTTPQGDPSQSPTLTAAATQMGVIMGTAAYMSPEQARGKPVDKRADIWAFGSVLFEMLTGQRPFVGDDATDILAAVVRAEPEWNRLPPHLDPRLKGLIERCLEKDVRLRWHDVGDVRVDITKVEDNLEESAVTLNADQANWSDPYRRLGIAFVAGALLAGLTAWNLAPQGAGDSRMVRLSLDVLSSQEDAIQAGVVGTIAISADGARVAYVARGSVTAEPGSEPRRLYVRTLAEDQATAVSGTEGATNAFFSPDGTWVGFFAGGELQIAPVAGGAPLSVANANQVFGAAWGPNDTIVFGGGTGSGLWQVPAAGGAPEPLTSLDADKGEILHGLPEFLPDGETVLFTTGTSTGSRIAMLSLQTGAWEDLALSGAGARYVSDGYLVFSEEDSLRLFGFDAERKEVTGSVTPVQDGVQWETWAGLQLSSFATSRRGDLMFISGSQEFAQTRLV